MGKELENVKKVLKEYGQEHLLLKYDEMDEHDQRTLLDQIEDIDFDLMKELYEQATKPVDLETISKVTGKTVDEIQKIKNINQTID